MSPATGSLVFFPPGSGNGSPSQSERRVAASFAMPARLEAWLRVRDGSSSLGAMISFHASLVLSGIQVRVTFRSRGGQAERPDEEVSILLPLVASGHRVTRPGHKLGGVARSARLTLRLLDREGRALTAEQDVGACEDGIHQADVRFAVDTSAVAWVTALEWPERRGPRIRVSGERSFIRGVDARLALGPGGSRAERSSAGGTELKLPGPGTTL